MNTSHNSPRPVDLVDMILKQSFIPSLRRIRERSTCMPRFSTRTKQLDYEPVLLNEQLDRINASSNTSNSVIIPRSLMTIALSHFTLRVSGDPVLSPRGQAGVRIASSVLAECGLLDQIPVSSSLSADRLDGSVRVISIRLKRQCLLVIFVYLPTDYSSPEAKEVFFCDLYRFYRSRCLVEIVLIASNCNSGVNLSAGK